MASLDDIERILLKILEQDKKKERADKTDKVTGQGTKIAAQLDKLSYAFDKLGLGSRGSGGNGGSNTPFTPIARSSLEKSFKGFTPNINHIPGKLNSPIGTGEIPGQSDAPLNIAADAAATASEGTSEASGIAGLLGSAGEGLASIAAPIEAIAGPIGIIVGAVTILSGILVKIATTIVNMPWTIQNWANSLLKSQEYLKQFSGAMAAVFNRKEIFETYQNMRIGAATSASAGNLEAAYESLSQALEPINILLSNIWNEGLTIIVQIMTVLVDIIKYGLKEILIVLQTLVQIMSIANGIQQAVLDWWKGKDKETKVSPFEGFARNFHKQVAAAGIR